MRSITSTKARQNFSAVLEAAKDSPVVISFRGRTRGAVLCAADFREYQRLRKIANEGAIILGLEKALENLRIEEGQKALGILRKLAPYWREAGVKTARRAR
jgi:prevent-host-death family protein